MASYKNSNGLVSTAFAPVSLPLALNIIERRELLRYLVDSESKYNQNAGSERDFQSIEQCISRSFDALRLNRFLQSRGVSYNDLIVLGNATPHELGRTLRTLPEWFQYYQSSVKQKEQLSDAPKTTDEFTAICLPIISKCFRQLNRKLDRIESPHTFGRFDRKALLSQLETALKANLAEITARPIVAEMRIASRLNLLHGNSPEERYRDFFRRFTLPEVKKAFQERYPLVVRLCTTRALFFANSFIQTLSRVCRDWEHLEMLFGNGRTLKTIQSVEFGLGDPHRGGQTVTRIRFASGVEIIYKPRSLEVDLRFQRLLAWASNSGDFPAFYRQNILTFPEYGYVECIYTKECASREEIARFFYRQGIQLAFLYIIGGSDIHSENVIAVGEYPVLVDLETLFNPVKTTGSSNVLDGLISKAFQQSVLSSGLLPLKLNVDPRFDPVDISGLSRAEGQMSPMLLPVWEDSGKDTMFLDRRQFPLEENDNLPKLNGKSVSLTEHIDDLVSGFVTASNFIMRNKEKIRAHIMGFSGCKTRYVVRHTYQYAFLLTESCHPDLLKNAILLDLYFSQLIPGNESHFQADLHCSEVADLWKGDVPYFTTEPNSRSLYTSEGNEISGYFEQSGLSASLSRLNEFSAVILKQQLWFLSASVASVLPVRSTNLGGYNKLKAVGNDLLIEAERIGAYLTETCFLEDEAAGWITLTEGRSESYEPSKAGISLYNGLSGIAFFLAYLSHCIGEVKYGQLAMSAVCSISKSDFSRSGCGAFDGVAGVIYTLAHIYLLSKQHEWKELANQCLDRISETKLSDDDVDIIGGASGIVLSLIAYHIATKDEKSVDILSKLGTVLKNYVKSEGFRGASGFKLGLGHGIVGVAYAIWRLYIHTHEEEYEAILNSLLSELLRINPKILCQSPNTWCNGLSGTMGGLMRICSQYRNRRLPRIIRKWYREETAAILLETDCLCHGEMGNIEMLIFTNQWLGQSNVESAVKNRVRRVLMRAAVEGWAGGGPVDSPALMNGLAGIGYQLLRLAKPEIVPSLLFLDPPVGRI
jgi:type 2 lantibiotic biosynthesis protein LanM